MKKVAVTGGIASGKSTVCHLLEDLGAYVLSADSIVHELLSPLTDLGKKVTLLLGSEVIVNGKFDRKKIASIVFNDQQLLLRLEKLLHPEVLKVIETRYNQVSQNNQKYSLFVVEFPLLFETKNEKTYDIVIVVKADEKVSKERFEHAKDFERREKRLIPMKEKEKKADFLIVNNGSMSQLKESVLRVYQQLTSNE